MVLIASGLAAIATVGIIVSATVMGDREPAARSSSPMATPRTAPTPSPVPSITESPPVGAAPPGVVSPPVATRQYPWHTGIVSTTFWVGEIFDPDASDGSQVLSTYDSGWLSSYGGCDGVVVAGECRTERRTASNDYFPTGMTPRENPFYLDLPFDDINDGSAFRVRESVIPWAGDAAYRGVGGNQDVSLMKNRWVMLRANGQTCYGQIQDAGPGVYDDAGYVFGSNDQRPANSRYNGAGMDVSPALNGCLRFADLDGDSDRVDWRFVEFADVPAGPWRRIVTTSGVR